MTNETAGKLVYVYHNLKQIGTEDGQISHMPMPVNMKSTRSSAPATVGDDSTAEADHVTTEIEEGLGSD